MIRLIATDLDGSLLPDDKKVPEDFFTLLPELKKRGISVFSASGRTYRSLLHNFKDVSDQIGYICENGAYVVHEGKVLLSATMSMEEMAEILETVQTLPDVQPVLCGEKNAYMTVYPPAFEQYMSSYHYVHQTVSDYWEAKDCFYKLAICDLRGPENNSFPVLSEKFGDRFGMFISGKNWMDIMVKGINKGAALAKVQKTLGILPVETLAFGDYYNDIELLEQASYGFVMKNAVEDMKKNARYITPHTNNENGVMEVVRKFIFDSSMD